MDPITPQTRIKAGPDVLFSHVGDEAVLLHVKSGVYYALDRVGVLVWTRAIEGQPLGEIQAFLHQQFAVESDVLWADLVDLLADLSANDLVIVSPDA